MHIEGTWVVANRTREVHSFRFFVFDLTFLFAHMFGPGRVFELNKIRAHWSRSYRPTFLLFIDAYSKSIFAKMVIEMSLEVLSI